MQSIEQWLAELGLGQYASIFVLNDIGLEILPNLTEDDLKELGLSLGHRRKFQIAIANMTGSDNGNEPEVEHGKLESPVPGAERRQITVMFCDLVGSTALSERFDPEDLGEIVRIYHDCCADVIGRFDGYISEFLGDGILVYFGYPQTHEDDAERALRASLEINDAVKNLTLPADLSLQVRIGIASGLVVVGETIGSGSSRKQTAVGETPNIAARLQSLAEPSSIVIAQSTRQSAGDLFEYEDLGVHSLKGISEPLQIWQVSKARETEGRFEANRVRRGLTPFTGREEEIRILRDSLNKARSGVGQFVTVVGEPGVGKSRLLHEFLGWADEKDVLVLHGRCQSYSMNTSYLPFIDCLHRELQLHETDSIEKTEDSAVSNIMAIDPLLEQYIPFFLQLLSIPGDRYPLTQRFRGEEKRRAFEEALAAIFTAASRSQPLILVLEDWHWADELSDSVLKYLIGAITNHPILVIANYRPDFREEWGRLSHHTAVTLRPLEVESTESMIRSSLNARVLPQGLGNLIYHRTLGNPLFIEEICSALLEDDSVLITEEDAVLARPLEEIALPDTVQAVIRSRLDKLEPDHQEVLRLASVIGREFSKRILDAVHSEKSELDQSLSGLISQDLIQQLRVIPEIEYMFKHVLTQVVVYDTLLLRHRRQLHVLVGQAMESLYSDRLSQFYEALAHHFDAGGNWNNAVNYGVLAGKKAMQHHAIDAALSHFDRANEIIKSEEVEVSWRVRFDLSFQRSIALGDRGHWPAAYQEMSQAEEIARTENSRTLQIESKFALMNAAFWAHLFDESVKILGELKEILGDDPNAQLGIAAHEARSSFMLGDLGSSLIGEADLNRLFDQAPNSPHVSTAAFWIGVFHRWRGDNEAAEKALELAVKIDKQGSSAGVYIQSFMHYCLAIGEVGRYQEAIRNLEEAKEYGERADSRYGVLKIDNCLGWAYLEICNFDAAIRHNRMSLMSTDQVRGVSTAILSEVDSFARLNLGDTYATMGDLSRARDYYEQAYENAKDNKYFLARTRWKPRCLIGLAEIWLALGDLDRVDAYLAEVDAEGFTEGFPFKKHISRLCRVRANLAIRRGKLTDATEHLRTALVNAQLVGNPTQLWKTFQAIGELELAAGNEAEALTNFQHGKKVIDGVADNLTDSELKKAFLQAAPIQQVLDLARRS